MLRFRATRAGGGPSISSAAAGNIGTDLMIQVLRLSDTLETAALEGMDPGSDACPTPPCRVSTTHAVCTA